MTLRGRFGVLVQQKGAWFDLGIVAVACSVGVTLALVVDPWAAPAAIAVLALVALKPWLFGTRRRRRTGSGEVLFDERDASIHRRATALGFTLSYVAFIAACMAPWTVVYLIGGEDVVSVHLLVVPVLVGWLVAIMTSAVATLAAYGRRSADDEAGGP
jgi:hypothetical protein